MEKEFEYKEEYGWLTNICLNVTDACNLACTYCYQINKGTRKMSFETAKKFVDYLLTADESNTYINPKNSP